MPNWTYNTVEMNGIAKENLFETIDRNGKTYTGFDFNKLIPEPKNKEECLEKYGERYIDNGNRSLMHDEGDEWFNWYDWHCDFWGTKWGACDTCIVDDNTINFSTAWSEPEPIWVALSKRYPDKEIKIAASYEDSWETRSAYLNGERIEYSEWEREYEDDDYDYEEEVNG